MSLEPIPMQWNGLGFDVRTRFQKAADERFTIGEIYLVDAQEISSGRSRGHYFAVLSDAWESLPETIADRYPTVEHLRKWALIRAGFRDERSIVCATKAEAQRFAAFVKPMDDFAAVVVSEAVVTVLTAKSQSTRAMGGKAFQESKTKVLEIVSDLIGVDPTKLQKRGSDV